MSLAGLALGARRANRPSGHGNEMSLLEARFSGLTAGLMLVGNCPARLVEMVRGLFDIGG